MRTTMAPQLLVGTDSLQCEKFIESFLMSHPYLRNSIYKIFPEVGKHLSIEQIRSLKKELLISAVQRVVVIYDFQLAKAEAQNALLKTLEDQTDYTQFFLCTNQVGSVLPTILSRCQIIDLVTRTSYTLDEGLMTAIDELFTSPTYTFLGNTYFQANSLDEAKELFHKILVVLQKKIQNGNTFAAMAAKEALEYASLLHSNNLSPQLAIDAWCLMVKKYIQQA